jgi:hypothetical protein
MECIVLLNGVKNENNHINYWFLVQESSMLLAG